MRPVAFILAQTEHGLMILPRFDQKNLDDGRVVGVGIETLSVGAYMPDEIRLCLDLLQLRRRYHGDGVVAIDVGANVGTHTLSMARHMDGWGKVIAIEAQERLFYALAGNIVANNLFNAEARYAVVSDRVGATSVPQPDYRLFGNFGGLEVEPSFGEDIGQRTKSQRIVPNLPLDVIALDRCDLIKIDVEGMEMKVLAGAEELIRRHQPILYVEQLKSDKDDLTDFFNRHGYQPFPTFMSILAVHESDPCREHIRKGP